MVTIYNSARPRGKLVFWDILPIVSTIGDLWSSAMSAESNEYAAQKSLQATRETNETNLQLAREQNDWNYDMWQKTNEYNTTANQLARWTAAGLNPNSFASQASPVAADNIQSADLANQQVPDLSALNNIGAAWQSGVHNALNNLLAYKQLNIANKKADAEIKKLAADSDFVKAQVEKLLPQQIEESKSRSKLNEEQVTNLQKRYAEIAANVENLYASANLSDTISNEKKLDMNFLKETWNTKKTNLRLVNALTEKQIAVSDQQAHNLAEQLHGIVIENGLKGNEFVMSEVTNWLKKVQAASATYEFLSDSEKANFNGELFSMLGAVIGTLSEGPTKQSERKKARRDWRYNLLEQSGSWANPYFSPLPSR